MLGLLHMHYVDCLVRLLVTSAVLESERWSLFIWQHQQMELQAPADNMALYHQLK